MRPITRRALRVINSDEHRAVTLIDIRVAGASAASTVRLTDAGEQLTWNSNTYYPVHLSRGQLDERLLSDAGGIPSLQINLSNISTQFATMLQENVFEDADVTVRVADRRLLTNIRDAWIIAKGRLRQPTLTRSVLGFRIVSILGDLERINIPRRLWQPHCNYTYGSTACGVDLLASPNSISAAIQTGTTKNYVVVPSSVLTDAGNPSDPNGYWAEGVVIIASGAAATQACPIYRYEQVGSQRRFYVRRPFLVTPEVGETVVIRRGCTKTKSACIDRQGDANNFGGFEEVPYGNIKPTIIGGVPEV